ncbi:MAG: polyprenyl synthetase family protein [Tissierellia bacterium]|nr:polyprenyl synthetase family protein [Tissierellia bacterium]
MLFGEIIEDMRKVIDNGLRDILAYEIGYQDKIIESIGYSIFTGGKRIRPILLLKTCEAFSGSYKQATSFALAIEMIHTYSLIHDDLPSMDDDDFRRGKPTNHKVFGDAIAILSGDGLLNLAFETMLDHTLNNSTCMDEYKKNIRAMDEVARHSGIYGMVGGQVVDLLSNDIAMDEDTLLFMYRCKTAALIQASVVAGTILGGGSDKAIEDMRRFGLNLGLAYQIRDDILDREEDAKMKKITYLTYNSVQESMEVVENLSAEAIGILGSYEDMDMEFLKDLTKFLIERKI